MAQPEFNGRQSLRITHNADGTAGGVLKCSIVLALSAEQALECTDVVTDLAVGCVLNPINGVFLADEIQRVMRVGLATWLVEELSEQALTEVRPRDLGKTLNFSLLDLAGKPLNLVVEVAADAPSDSLVPLARTQIREWAKTLSKHCLPDWVAEELSLADLRGAPLLQCGMAQLNLPEFA